MDRVSTRRLEAFREEARAAYSGLGMVSIGMCRRRLDYWVPRILPGTLYAFAIFPAIIRHRL